MRKIICTILTGLLFPSLYAQTGSLNKNFGANGVVETIAQGSGSSVSGETRKSFVQADGKILVVVELSFEVVISRRLPNGGLDSAYGKNGFSAPVVILDATAAIQNDGKIVVAGTTTSVNSDFITARFNTNGTLDQSFGSTGIVITDGGSQNDALTSVAIQADGKIVAGGQSNRNGISQFALIRYTGSGALDPTFGQSGVVITNFGNSCNISAVTLQNDNKIIAAGNYSTGSTGDFAIARYLANGSLDTSFNHNGELTSNFGNSDNAIAAAIQTNEKILVGGYYSDPSGNSHFEIARYNANGSTDSTFNGDGLTGISFGDSQEYLTALVLQANGKIVAGGYKFNNGLPQPVLARFNSSGGTDSSFGNFGQILDTVTASSLGYLNCLTIGNNGQVITGGQTNINNFFDFTLSEFSTAGILNNNFGSSGNLIGSYPGIGLSWVGALVQPDGKLVTYGNTYNGTASQNILARFNQNGNIDAGYGHKGMANSNGYFAAIQSDGKVVEANNYSTPTQLEIMTSRYTVNGTLDHSYGTNGIVFSDFFGQFESYGPIAVQQDNKLVMAGYIYNSVGTDLLLVRFNSNGTPDASFGTGGAVEYDFENSEFPDIISIDKSGRILVGEYGYNASGDQVMVIARFSTNGSADPSFGQNGQLVLNIGLSPFPGSFALQSNGSILLAYETTYDNSTYNSYITRLKPNGITDSTFGTSGTVAVNGPNILIEADQKILVSGNITDNQNNSDFFLSRYKSNGTIDKTFGTNGSTTTSFTQGVNYESGAVITNNELVAAGNSNDPVSIGVIAEYQLGAQGSISGPLSIVTQTDSGLCAARVNNLDPVISSTDTSLSAVVYQLSGATEGTGAGSLSGTLFNKGITYANYSIQGDPGGTSSFTITVEDREAPVISNITKKISLSGSENKSIDILLDYAATDNCGTVTSFVSGPESLSSAGKNFTNWEILNANHMRLNAPDLKNEVTSGLRFAFRVSATDQSGNQAVKSDTLEISAILTTLQDDFNITTAPNPSSNFFTVGIHSEINQRPLFLRLVNDKGMEVEEIKELFPGRDITVGSSLPTGVYFLMAIRGGVLRTTKLIKL